MNLYKKLALASTALTLISLWFAWHQPDTGYLGLGFVGMIVFGILTFAFALKAQRVSPTVASVSSSNIFLLFGKWLGITVVLVALLMIGVLMFALGSH